MPPYPSGSGIEQLLLAQGQRRAALTQQLGQIAAETQARNSQLWGNTLAQLGQLPTQIYGLKLGQQEMQLREQQLQAQQEALKQKTIDRNYGIVSEAAIGSFAQALGKQNDDGTYSIDPGQMSAKMAEIGTPLPLQEQTLKQIDLINKSNATLKQARIDHAADQANMLLQLPPDQLTPEAVHTVMAANQMAGTMTAQEASQMGAILQQAGGNVRPVLESIRNLSSKYAGEKPVSVAPGASLVNPVTGTPLYQAPERPVSVAPGSSLINPSTGEVLATSPESQAQLDTAQRVAAGAAETARHNQAMEGIARQRLAQGPASGPNASQDQNDVKETVRGMIEGTIPPQLPSRASREYMALTAEAHRQGFDLAKANQDWTATQKYLGTLNGQQQTRLRQAVAFTRESVPTIRSLVSQWDAGRFPVLNAANLKLAMNGAYGQQAASVATRLNAQIADLTSELGTVYKGGNSSTDESLRLAAENLKADWSKKVAMDALDQIDRNLTIRENSMRNVGVAGISDNQYTPKATAPKRFNPDTGKIE